MEHIRREHILDTISHCVWFLKNLVCAHHLYLKKTDLCNEYGVRSQSQEGCTSNPEIVGKLFRHVHLGRPLTRSRETVVTSNCVWWVAPERADGACQVGNQKASRFGQFRVWKQVTCLDSKRQIHVVREVCYPLVLSQRRH